MSEGKPKILLVGGGTMGSISPLLAIAKSYPAHYLFLVSELGPEIKIVSQVGIASHPIKSGKFRRYWDWRNLSDIVNVLTGFFQSLKIIFSFKPDILLTAGSFVAVPVAWAAWICRVPIVVHQQDIKVGLANRIMAPLARRITVTFPDQVKYFNSKKCVVTGNPCRLTVSLQKSSPKVLITGGGVGARGLNEFIRQFIPKLVRYYEVHHILGERNIDQKLNYPNYFTYSFVTDKMSQLLVDADIIISRAGMSLITEAAALKKALVLVPMVGTHQEKNAGYLAKKNAAIMVKQGSHQILDRYLNKLLDNQELRQGLGNNLYNLFPHNALNDYKILIDQVLRRNGTGNW